MATMWDEALMIWKQIEKCKSDMDLRRVLTRKWGEYQGNLSRQYYDILWMDKLLTAIRKVAFVETDTVEFASLETGIILINFMPCSEAEMGKIRCVQELRRAMKGTWTQVDERKAYRAPRCPQGTYERMLMLYTMYAMFLEMLFSKANAHLVGLNHVRRQLMSMAKISTRLSPLYFANVTWAVLEDAFKHFSKNTELEDFKVQDPLSGVIWPSSSLLATATQMAGGTMIDYLGIPDEWRNMLTGPTTNTPWSGMGHRGGHTTVAQGSGGDRVPYQQGGKDTARTNTAGGVNTPEFRPNAAERTNK
jgi:hypothetical protein